MRSRSTERLIPVSCGHRVPRVAVQLDGQRGNRYWCETCGEYRMSGGHSTGREFEFLLELKEEITARELVVTFPHALAAHQLAVVNAFGATARIAREERK